MVAKISGLNKRLLTKVNVYASKWPHYAGNLLGIADAILHGALPAIQHSIQNTMTCDVLESLP